MPILGIIASSIAKFALTWSSATAGSTDTLGNNIGFGAGIFLIGPRLDNNNYFTSSNATTWTERTSPGAVAEGGWAGSYFVLFDFGTTTFYKSSDGISWTSGTVSPAVSTSRYSGNIRYDATSGVAIMSVNQGYLEYAKSTDGGSTWAKGGDSSGTGFNGVQIAHNDNGKWGYSGELSKFYYSSDATNWTLVSSTPSGNAGAVFGGGGLFIWRSDTAGTTYYTSTDAISWTSRTFPVSGVYNFGWNGTRWIAIVNSGTESYHSTDGITWTAATNSKTSGTTNQYAMVANSFTGAGKMVAPLRATNTVNYANI